jgi:hypothetical protein
VPHARRGAEVAERVDSLLDALRVVVLGVDAGVEHARLAAQAREALAELALRELGVDEDLVG